MRRCWVGLGSVSGQSWARDPYGRPRLGKCYIDQRELARGTSLRFKGTPKWFFRQVVFWRPVVCWSVLGRCWVSFGSVSGQSWARDRYERPRLGKCCINQRELARETDSMVFWKPGVPRPRNHTCSGKEWFVWRCRLWRQGQENTVFLHMCCFGALAPQASKKNVDKKPLRDPFEP